MEILTVLLQIISILIGYSIAGTIWIIIDTELLGSRYGNVVTTVVNILLWPISIAYRIAEAL